MNHFEQELECLRLQIEDIKKIMEELSTLYPDIRY
jgi:hypothetical protein